MLVLALVRLLSIGLSFDGLVILAVPEFVDVAVREVLGVVAVLHSPDVRGVGCGSGPRQFAE